MTPVTVTSDKRLHCEVTNDQNTNLLMKQQPSWLLVTSDYWCYMCLRTHPMLIAGNEPSLSSPAIACLMSPQSCRQCLTIQCLASACMKPLNAHCVNYQWCDMMTSLNLCDWHISPMCAITSDDMWRLTITISFDWMWLPVTYLLKLTYDITY